MTYLTKALAVSIFFATPASTKAATMQAFTVEQVRTLGGGASLVGYQFVPQQDIVVTALGLADLFVNIVDNPHTNNPFDTELAIYREDDQLLLGSALLPGNNTFPLEGGSRFVDVDDFALQSGVGYRIAAFFPTAGFVDDFAERTDNPLISFGQRFAHNNASEIVFPSLNPETGPSSGPNFQFFVVPEPSTLLLAGCSVVLLWWRQTF